MSHFTVMVVLDTDDQKALEAALQPYHEYECTGIKDEYVVWVDEHEEHLADYEARDADFKKDYPSFDLFMAHYHEYGPDRIRNGRWGRETNPNAQWDWWVIGGRWSNHWLLKNGNSADYAQKADIDIEGMIQRQREKMIADIAKYNQIAAGRDFVSWEDAKKLYPDDINAARGNEAEYLKDFVEDKALSTYAVVKDDKWHQKGEMGWWGMSSNESDEWPNQWRDLFDSCREDQWLVIVDCHI